MASKKIKYILFGIFILLIAGVIAFQITSSSFSGRNKFDFGGSGTQASSTSFIQRFIFGNQPVSKYESSTYSGRFGILDDVAVKTNISTCGNLTTTNGIYTLNQSVNSSGTCFTILAENVTINCNSGIINYTQTTTGYAVTSNGYNYSTIKNCKIVQGRTNAANSYGIYLRNGYNSTIQDNNLTLSGSSGSNANNYGIYLNNQIGNIIYKNNITTTGKQDYGIYLYSQSNSTNISSNKISIDASFTHGISLRDSSSNIISQNNISMSGGINAINIYLRDSANNNITSNNLTGNGNSQYGVYILGVGSSLNRIETNEINLDNRDSIAIYLYDRVEGAKVLYNNITLDSSGSYGVQTYWNVNYSMINHNKINLYGTSSTAIRINTKSNRNNVTNNIIYANSSGSGGIFITSDAGTGAVGNLIMNNTVDVSQYALFLTRASSSKIYNNIFNATSKNIVSATKDASYVNELNTTKTDLTPNTNIAGGNFLAGNYWVNSLGTGFSQTCADSNNNGLCDSNYSVNAYNIDYIALRKSDSSVPSIRIISPTNESFVNGRVSLVANASDGSAVANVVFQYSNSSVSWTNLPDCNLTSSNYQGNYRCYWQTSTFSNNSAGYNVKAVAYDVQGNTAESIRHYTIDRTKPIIYELNVVYPSGQESVRNTQKIVLGTVVTDAPDISAGINNVQADLTSLNSTSWTEMTLVSGSKASDMNSTWNLSVSVDSTTGMQFPGISVYDAATPAQNNVGQNWSVQVDNNAPTYSGLTSSTQVYNNTKGVFAVSINDNFKLDYYIFSQNWSGIWVNDSSVDITGTSDYLEHEKIVYSGNFSYRFFIFDDAGNMNKTSTGNIEVYGAAPVPIIYLISPLDNLITKNNLVTFQYYYLNGDLDNCSLRLDGIENQTVTNPLNNSVLSFTSLTLADGEHSWYVSCLVQEMEGEGNVTKEYLSENIYNLKIDTIPPLITIVSPANSTYAVSIIKYNISINEDAGWCGYSFNDALNVTMTKINSTYFSNIVSGMLVGGHIVFSCNDSANNYNSSEKRFAIDFMDIFVNLSSPLNNAEIVRGHDATGGVANEDDLGLASNYLGLIAKVYNDSDGGLEGATCYFYFNNSLINESYTNSSGNCNVSYDKSSRAVSVYNLSVNYTYLVTDVSRNVNNSGINISLTKYVSPNFVGGKGVATQYVDNQTAIFYFNITKVNESGTFFYEPQNITVNATNSVNTPYPETAYVTGYRIYKTAVGQYETRVVVNLTFGTYIRWKIYISDNNWTSYLGTALHSDVQIVNTPICGNSRIEGTETCDDGNIVAGDGCSASCATEGTTPSGGGRGGTTPPPEVCTNDCASGTTRKVCAGSGTLKTETCGNYDVDACTEWGGESYSDCGAGKVCENAQCVIKACDENTCIGWSECVSGVQTRTCVTPGCELSKVCAICSESWNCDWTTCAEGDKSSNPYNCVDLNNCGTATNKPIKSITCEEREMMEEDIECPRRWKCGDWGECITEYDINDVLENKVLATGYSSRECADLNGCALNKTEKTPCDLAIPIYSKENVWCNESYVEVFEVSTDKLVSRVKEKEIVAFSDLKRVDISFMTSEFTGYCDYCFDGVKNYDETQLDCGGANCPKCIAKSRFFDWVYWVVLTSWVVVGLFAFALLLRRRKEEKRIAQRARVEKSLFERIKFFVKNKLTAHEERVKEKKIGGFFKKLFGKKREVERVRKLEVVLKKVVSSEERALSQLKAKLKVWKAGGYAGTSALESKIISLENRIANKERSFVKRVILNYKRKREEKKLEKIRLQRREENEIARGEREKTFEKIRRQREWNKEKTEFIEEKNKMGKFFKSLFKSKKKEEQKPIKYEKGWFAGFISKFKKKREVRKEEERIIKIRKKIKKEVEKPKKNWIKKVIYNYKARREKKKREKEVKRIQKEIKIIPIKREVEKPKKSLIRKAIGYYKIHREKRKKEKVRKKIEKEFRKKAERREKEVQKRIHVEKKIRRKERKKKIRKLKKEVRKIKLINLMRKLRLWKKEGYYGTAHLGEEIKRLKSQED